MLCLLATLGRVDVLVPDVGQQDGMKGRQTEDQPHCYLC